MKDEKMKDREMWMDKLKEKLENYSEPIPPFGWEQLEKELVPPVKKRSLSQMGSSSGRSVTGGGLFFEYLFSEYSYGR